MNNSINFSSENNKEISFGEKIIRKKPIESENGFKNYFCCSEPVTYRGTKDGHIITDEYGFLGIEYSDDNWIRLKNIMVSEDKTSLSEFEGCYIRRVDSLKIRRKNLNLIVCSSLDTHKVNEIYMESPALLLKATKHYLVVIFEEEYRILDERYTNVHHWVKVEDNII